MSVTPGVLGGNSRKADKFVVRLEPGMRQRVEVIARSQHRSMNSYFIRALAVSLQIDEENAGTYVAPEEDQEVVSEAASAVMETRPQWAVGMACRYLASPKVIKGIIVDEGEGGDYLSALLDFGGSEAYVPVDDLEPY